VDNPSERVDKTVDEMLKTQNVFNIVAHRFVNTLSTMDYFNYNKFFNLFGRKSATPLRLQFSYLYYESTGKLNFAKVYLTVMEGFNGKIE
jgi:hypothetical protein